MARKLCTVCNIRPVGYGTNGDQQGAQQMDMCTPDYELANWENTHSDYSHDADSNLVVQALGDSNEGGHRVEGCWICFPELDDTQKPYVKRERTGHHSPRRAQLNHRYCLHAQTPKARRDCRNAFWATGTEDFNAYRASVWQAAGYVAQDGKWVHESVIAAEAAKAAKPKATRTRRAKTA